jgi:type IV secretion system protein TrbL
MTRFRLAVLAAAVAVLVLVAISPTMAAPTAGTLDQIVTQYQSQASAWAGAFNTVATDLFWLLFGIEFAVSAAMLAIQKPDMGDWFAFLVRQLVVVGIWQWILQNATAFAQDIIISLQQAAAQAGAPYMTPSAIFTAGANTASALVGQLSFWHPGDSLGVIICAIIILLGFVVITAMMIMTLAEAYFICSIAALFIAFGAFKFSRDIAISFLRFAVSVGFKLLTMQLLIGIGSTFIQQWGNSIGQMTFQAIFIMIGVTITLAALTKMLPDAVQRVVLGSSMSLAHYSHMTSAALAAAAIAAAPVVTAVGSAAMGATAFRLGAEELTKRDEQGSAPSSSTGRAAVVVGSMSRAVAGAGIREIGNRLGGRIGGRGSASIRMAQDIRHQQRVSTAERQRPDPGGNS